MEKMSRTPRDLETRESEERAKSWRPPALLPLPAPQAGYTYRWVRTSALGESDSKNVSQKFRENWTPVKRADHPELQILTDKNSQWPDGVEVGGLLLCKASKEARAQRNEYYEGLARKQLEAVDNSVMKTNDPRMPMARPERRSTVSLGKREDAAE